MIRPSLLSLVAATLLVCPAARALDIPTATRSPHPTQLVIDYKKELRPVLRMQGTDPIVMIDGKEKRVRHDVLYLPTRVRDFSPHKMVVSGVSLSGTQMIQVWSEADTAVTTPRVGSHGGLAEFGMTLKAGQTVKNGFVVIVLFSPIIFTDILSDQDYSSSIFQSQIVVRELPELPAGVAVPFKFTSKMFDYTSGQQYFVQVFDGEGREVLTNITQFAWPYFSLVERLRLKGAVERYIEHFSGQNHPISPVVTIKPLLPEGTPRPESPVTVRLTVSPQGWVTAVNISGTQDSNVRNAVQEAMMGWLFFPKLVMGQPVESQAEMPIHF